MSDRSGTPSDEGEGDEITPHGDDRDSSEESSEEDPEELRRIAEGFIVQDEDEDVDAEDSGAERRRRKEEKKRRKRRERQRREELELSDDELELLQENRGLAGPSKIRPVMRRCQPCRIFSGAMMKEKEQGWKMRMKMIWGTSLRRTKKKKKLRVRRKSREGRERERKS